MARAGHLVVVTLLLLSLAAQLGARRAAAQDAASGPTVSTAVAHGFLPQLCPASPEPAPNVPAPPAFGAPATMPAPSANFDGTPALPPDNQQPFNQFPADPSGAVGPSDYVQSTNFTLTVFTKDGQTRCPAMPTAQFWQPLAAAGSPCYADWSDEVILFDHDANRWFASRFAVVGSFDESEAAPDPNQTTTTTTTPPASYQCFAVSTSSDPTKSWQLYVFKVSDQYFGDYPKFGIWPDAYYMTANPNKIFSKTGVIAAAFDRQAMLAGAPNPRMVEFFVPANGRQFGMLPADRDGPRPPPPGSPGVFVEPRDTNLGFDAPGVGVWSFHVDWGTPSASTFTPSILPVAPFNSNICGGNQQCMPQATLKDKIDSLAYGYLMYRAAYRNLGDRQAIVLNQTVDANGRGGIRWYELSDTGRGWTVRQQSTYAPDADWRWMGSIAMDGVGDIAMGFTGSNDTSTLPSLRYVGRLASDPLNELPRQEITYLAGSGGRTDGQPEWSDWSQTTLDPVDDCTFWHTGQYMASPANGHVNQWS